MTMTICEKVVAPLENTAENTNRAGPDFSPGRSGFDAAGPGEARPAFRLGQGDLCYEDVNVNL